MRNPRTMISSTLAALVVTTGLFLTPSPARADGASLALSFERSAGLGHAGVSIGLGGYDHSGYLRVDFGPHRRYCPHGYVRPHYRGPHGVYREDLHYGSYDRGYARRHDRYEYGKKHYKKRYKKHHKKRRYDRDRRRHD